MECIQSMTYSVLINGEPTEPITPTRGIRQGYPLSPLPLPSLLGRFKWPFRASGGSKVP